MKLPWDDSCGAKGAEKNLSITIHVLKTTKTHLYLSACVPGAFLAAGMATFEVTSDGKLSCSLVHVEPNYRRQGIATELYDFAEGHFAKQITPSLQLTPDSIAFLTARGLTIPATAEVKSYDEWFDVTDSESYESDT